MIQFANESTRSEVTIRKYCCEECRFEDRHLVVWKDSDTAEFSVHCKECFLNVSPAHNSGDACATIYLPEMSVAAFSIFCRVLQLTTFKIAVDHQANEPLPHLVANESFWRAQIAEPSLRTRLNDHRSPPSTVKSIRKVLSAVEVLNLRAEATKRKFGSTDRQELETFVGLQTLKNQFRTINHAIDLPRLRSWGATPASLRCFGRDQF